MSSPFDRVVVVSLPESEARRRHIRAHLPAMGLPDYSFFDAIAAADPAVAAAAPEVKAYPPCFRCGALDCGRPDCNNFLLPAQIATFLTYRRLWRAIAEGDAERVLVVEDDVWLHPQCQRVLAWIADETEAGQLPFRGDRNCLLRLGWALCPDHEAVDAPVRVEQRVKMANPCHAITRAFARALLDRDRGIVHTVDVYQHQLAPEPGEAFTIFPPIASELSWSEGMFASLIHPKAVRAAYLRETGDERAAAEAEAQVMTHVKKKHFRPLLVVGHPRCGTGYAANLCRQLGVAVGHEKVLEQGVSSWMFAVDSDANPYASDALARTRRALAWDHLVLPLRDLEAAVPSVMRDSEHAPPSYDFRRRHILDRLDVDLDRFPTAFERAVRSITGWTRIVHDQEPALVFRIEDQHEDLRRFLIAKGLAAPEAAGIALATEAVNADKPYKGVRHPKPAIARADWLALGDETRREVEWYCRTFGYASPFPTDASSLVKQFLDPSGWSRSLQAEAPLTRDGRALPWFTYAAIEMLGQIVRPDDRVFEFGAGYSTLWWQAHAGSVDSVEHDAAWVERLKPRLGGNARLEARVVDTPVTEEQRAGVAAFFARTRRLDWPYDEAKVIRRGLEDPRFIAYATRIDTVDPGGNGFDFIVIDGMARRLCAYTAIPHLKPDGFIVLDNSNRGDYDLAYTLLAEAGFRQIPCWGLVPGANFYTSTSLFTRSIARLPPASFAGNGFGLPEY